MFIWLKMGRARARLNGSPVRNTLSRRSASSSDGGVYASNDRPSSSSRASNRERSCTAVPAAKSSLYASGNAPPYRRNSRCPTSSPDASTTRSARSSLHRRVTRATSDSTSRRSGEGAGVLGGNAIRNCIRAKPSSTIRSSRATTSPGQWARTTSPTRRRVSGPKRSAGKYTSTLTKSRLRCTRAKTPTAPCSARTTTSCASRSRSAVGASSSSSRGNVRNAAKQLASGVAAGSHSRAQQDLRDALAHNGNSGHHAVFQRGDQAEEDVDGLAFPAGRRRNDSHAVIARRTTHG